MADDYTVQTPPYAGAPAPRRGAGRAIFGAALLAFVLGGGAVGYAVWQGLVPLRAPVETASGVVPAPAAPAAAPVAAPGDPVAASVRQDELERRMAALEQRLDDVNSQADAASGNAARAEALLVAFAARRAIERGAPLGYLEDQLRLRFGNAQPNAVATVLDAGRSPVTLDQLLAGLDSLAPGLTEVPSEASAWTKVKRQVASLFVIRHQSATSPSPVATLQRARILVETGRITDAIAAVQRLPGSSSAADWFTAARRYDQVENALDVLESSAMLDTRALRDASGRTVQQAAPPAA